MREHEQPYRTFIAIELPESIRAAIGGHIQRLRQRFPQIRASWSRENNLHLTLKFLGNVPVTRIPSLCDAAAAAACSTKPFDLMVKGCGSFPPDSRPKVLWIGIEDPSGGLHGLYEAVEIRCAEAGFERETRAHQPHLTIARLRDTKGTRALAEYQQQSNFASLPVNVRELVVFRSELRREGSIHTAISRHELTGVA